MTIQDVIALFKKGKSDEWVADCMNEYLPHLDHVTRQAVWQWQKKNSADPGVFWALKCLAPDGTAEYVLAHNALVSLKRIDDEYLPMVEAEPNDTLS